MRSNVYFFFNDTATTEIYTLSLHDALPILYKNVQDTFFIIAPNWKRHRYSTDEWINTPEYIYKDRKSTRLNSSHANISYAVFCLKKKLTCRPFPRHLSPHFISNSHTPQLSS